MQSERYRQYEEKIIYTIFFPPRQVQDGWARLQNFRSSDAGKLRCMRQTGELEEAGVFVSQEEHTHCFLVRLTLLSERGSCDGKSKVSLDAVLTCPNSVPDAHEIHTGL